MATLLRKIFIKNYKDVNDPKVREAHGSLTSWMGIFLNTILVVIKVAAALIVASSYGWKIFPISLLADAANNLVDLASSIMTLIGFKMSAKEADEDHPFGHERIEYIIGLIIAISALMVGIEFLKESITGIIQNSKVDYDLLSLIIVSVSVAIKIFQAYVCFSISKAINSLTIKEIGKDALFDCITTSLILVNVILSYSPLDIQSLDSYLGVVVSIFIMVEGILMIKETSSPLIGEKTNKTTYEQIKALILENKNVYGVHDIIVHSYGPKNRYASLHIELDESLSLTESHEIADSLEEELLNKMGIDATIHVDPSSKDEKIEILRKHILATIKVIDDKAEVHDIQLNDNFLSFDIMVPFQDEGKKKEMEEVLNLRFGDRYTLKIKFDHPF